MNVLKTIGRLVLGLLVIVLVAFFSLMVFTGWIKIWNVTLLAWFPLMLAGLGYYLAGRINRSTNPVFLLVLFGAFPIYNLVDLIYFPQVLLVIVYAFIGLILSRKELASQYRKVILGISVVVFLFFFVRDPLIFLYKDGVYKDGKPVFTVTLWEGFKSNTIPDGIYLDREGNEVDLRSFEGKEVYVTFWATWCGPCKYYKPALDSLKNSEVAQHLIFVDISIDKDEEQWKQYFETEERKGIQLIAKSPSKTMQDFQFEGIPRYVLLKADGKFQSVLGPNYFQLD